MVLHGWASFICSFMGIPSYYPPRSKHASSQDDHPRLSRIQEDASYGEALPGPASPSSSLQCSDGLESDACLCCVCLSGLKGAMDVDVLPCTHTFHRQCIDGWFSTGSSKWRTCPICRFKLDGGRGEAGSCRWEELTEEMAIWFSSFHVAGF
ncbi:hypothetical protein SAY86_032020 [Trapa natans]|uniref:RING-type E3 ubiquitin transferase n=1 Tax=Trapa natans TaxID=22666 RepID=A0AAN7LSW7_TRANT|nr:hypothetical protein SAY86_032020 [Trapa natans]